MIIFSISIWSFLFNLNSFNQQIFGVDFHLEPAELELQFDMEIKGMFLLKQEIGNFFVESRFSIWIFIICFSVKFPKSQLFHTRMKEKVFVKDSQSSHLKKYTWFFNFNPLDFLIFYFFSSLSAYFQSLFNNVYSFFQTCFIDA